MEKKKLTIEEIFALAVQNQQKNNLQVAGGFYKEILNIKPNHVDALNNLGVIFARFKEYKKAINCYKKLIHINPNYAGAHNNLGLVFRELGEQQKTIDCCKKAIEIQPNFADAHNNLGISFKELGEVKKSITYYEKAIQINPNFASAYNNLGNAFKELKKYQQATSCYEKAIEIQPNFAQAHTNLGFLCLLFSDLQKGFDKYEWRKKIPSKKIYRANNTKSLEWQGEDLTNKTILVFSEQGVGDVFQFARYLYKIQEKYSTTVIFRVKKKLIHLFSKSKVKVISDEDPLPKHDYHKFLLSLPQIFYKETKTIPQQINYIFKNEKIFSTWRDKLAKIDGIKVGINWQGNKNYESDRFRSIPLNFFDQLFTIDKINFINLQKGPGVEQIKNFKYKNKLYDFSPEMDNGKNAFEDTIGILQNIDLVITSDTALPHLSATLGIKTWLLLPFSPDWRWFLKFKNSPWYKHMKIYRQNEIDEWKPVFNSLKKDLINLKSNNSSRART